MAQSKIKIRGVQALIAVFEEKSFSAAARRENATQSGMSTQVKNLETALGTILLDRKTLELTPTGKAIYDDGRQILRALYDLEERVQTLTGAVTGRVRFGIIPGLTRAVLPRAMQHYRTTLPDVDVSVLEEYSYSLMRRVIESDLDCAIVPAGDVPKGLTASYIGTDQEVLVARADRFADLAQLSPVPPDTLEGLDLILPSTRNVRRRGLEDYFETHGIRPGAVLEMDAMLATLEFVATTDWCAVLPSLVCHPDRAGTLRKLHPLEGPRMTTDYIAVQRADRALPRPAVLLIDKVRTVTQDLLAEWAQATGKGATVCG